jgi:glycerophosphoryl diester phosphodiesterase
VIAHRGASAYLPEHTLAAKAMAYAQGANYLEQDLVMTQDGYLLVLHDLFLDDVSDVAERFPGIRREDGRHYVIDLTLAQLLTLEISERVDAHGAPRFPNRFPPKRSHFTANTFDQEIEFLQGLNRSTGGSVGLYPEIKSPAFHHDHGLDLASAMLDALKAYGYVGRDSGAIVQSFDATELQRVKHELMPQRGLDLPLTQLLTGAERSQLGLAEIANYANNIGIAISMLFKSNSQTNAVEPTDLVKQAHAHGLAVHVYTLRADQLPTPFTDLDDLHRFVFERVGVDGVFSDFPDRSVRFLNR